MIKPSKVYVLGVSGYIGSAFQELADAEGLQISKVGRSTEDDIYLDLSDSDPDFSFTFLENSKLVFLSSVSSPDQCEKNYEYAYRINVINTVLLIEKALLEGVSVLFASTDAVYGDSSEVVSESSEVSPISAYGKMKAEVESVFLGRSGFSSARFSYVWSMHDKFTKAVIESSRSAEVFQVFEPFYRRVISLDDVLFFIKSFIEKDYCPPLINLSGPDLLSRVDLINIIKGKVNVNYEVVFPGEHFFKSRPKCINMKSDIFFKYLDRYPESICDVFSKGNF